MNITVKVTAVESPFSNGLVPRYNFIIADMMDKVLEESQHFDMDLTLAWCLNGKNSPCMVFHHCNLCLDKTPNYHLPLLTNHQHTFDIILIKFSQMS